MGLPRTFVGFSSTDIRYYRLMQAWKASEHIDFNFTDCQLQAEIDSENEAYIKRKCRERINMAGKYVMLIGEDTRYKYKYVRWEAEVAIEKRCAIIGVNLDNSRMMNARTCPPVIRDVGAVFVAFKPRIIAHALERYATSGNGDFHYPDSAYQALGIADYS
ncbi:MAG: TIR domain-containing protein [Rhodocyclales bacterium]|nr:TIR domain-containing protein [Rhodocyclales bacterium]